MNTLPRNVRNSLQQYNTAVLKSVNYYLLSFKQGHRRLAYGSGMVLSGLPAAPGVLGAGGWGWQDWAILAATLIALALFLFLLFLLLCLLCPGGLCCGPAGLCGGLCCAPGAPCCGGGAAAARGEKEKHGLAAQTLEMSYIGGSQESSLTAVDLKLPRVWMDASKGDTSMDKGDLGLGLGHGLGHGLGQGSFGRHKAWSHSGRESHPHANDDAWRRTVAALNRSATFGNHSAYSGNTRRTEDGLGDGSAAAEAEETSSARTDYYRNKSADTIMSPSGGGGGNGRDSASGAEWGRKHTSETRRLVETRQTRSSSDDVDRVGRENRGFESQDQCGGGGGGGGEGRRTDRDRDAGYSSVTDSSHYHSSGKTTQEAEAPSMALVKQSGSGSGAGSGSGPVTTLNEDGLPVVQCYTVTKKVTTTTYGDDAGEEETAVVTTTEKKWLEGMNEVGEISVNSSATAGELLPSLGAPASLVADTSNVRTVKSLTNVEGGASNIVRRYEFNQQTSHDADMIYG